jgi:hypothetical protein
MQHPHSNFYFAETGGKELPGGADEIVFAGGDDSADGKMLERWACSSGG